MSFTLAGINDRLSKFVDEQVDGILRQLTLSDSALTQTWKVKTSDVSERVNQSPEVQALVQNIEQQLSRNILSARNNRVGSPGVVLDIENGINVSSFKSKLDRLPSVPPNTVSEITGILHAQPHDIVNSIAWSNMSVNLKTCLFCNNYSLFRLSLHIHAKLTHSISSSAIKEGLTNLSLGFQMYYKKLYADLVINFISGIDVQNPVHYCMVKICHLIVETVKILPNNWVRYGRRCVEAVCETFLNLLTFHLFTPNILVNDSKTNDYVYPFHLVSVLDPCANWCVCWLHGTLGQNVLFVTHISLAKMLLYMYVDVLLVCFNEEPSLSNTIMFATFLHSANALKAILHYRDGLKLFPVTASVGPETHLLTLYDLGLLLARYIVKFCSSEDRRQQEIVNCLSSLFLSLVETWPEKLVDEELMRVVMEHMHTPYIKSHPGSVQFTVSVLNTLLKSRSGVRALWSVEVRRKLPNRSHLRSSTSRSASGCRRSSISAVRQRSTKSLRVSEEEVGNIASASVVVKFTTAMLQGSPSHRLLEPLLDVCGSLLELEEGTLLLSKFEHALLSAAAVAYRQLSEQHCGAIPTSRKLLAFLTRVSRTPRGAYMLSRERDVILEALRAGMSDPVVCWDDPHLRLVTSRLLFVHAAQEPVAVESARVLARALDKLKDVCEDPEMLTGSERRFPAAMQYFVNIVYTLASTLEGVASLLKEADDGSSVDTLVDSDGPSSLAELLTSDAYTEDWHYITLLVLQLLVTDLDVLLYLCHKLNLQARLLRLQRENMSGQQPSAVIVDRCSLLRHRLLVTSYVVGGPGELEPTVPMFTSLPPPHVFYCRRKPASKTRTPLHRFLKDTEPGLRDAGWVVAARRAYVSSAHCDLKPCVVLSVVEQLARCRSMSAARGVDWSIVQPGELFTEDLHAVQLAVRYGVNCGLLQPSAQHVDSLTVLVRMCRGHRGSPHSFTAFPWFPATVFNLCGGSLDRCYSFLSDAWSLPASKYLRPKESLSECEVIFGHLLEHILATELPLAFNALQMGGVCWWRACLHWMGQCFWSMLDWPQICHWMVITFLYPPDYVLYLCVALLRHAQPQLLVAATGDRLVDYVKLEALRDFRVCDHLAFVEQLARSHRTTVLHHL